MGCIIHVILCHIMHNGIWQLKVMHQLGKGRSRDLLTKEGVCIQLWAWLLGCVVTRRLFWNFRTEFRAHVLWFRLFFLSSVCKYTNWHHLNLKCLRDSKPFDFPIVLSPVCRPREEGWGLKACGRRWFMVLPAIQCRCEMGNLHGSSCFCWSQRDLIVPNC